MTRNAELWQGGFEEPKTEFPDKLLAEKIRNFSVATEGLATLIIFDADYNRRVASGLYNTFQFHLTLFTDKIPGYSFEVFRFGYDVTLYPVDVILDDDIGLELKISRSVHGYKVKATTEDEFSEITTAALQSAKFMRTVGGLIKIAKAK